jgi:hypothetical protein
MPADNEPLTNPFILRQLGPKTPTPDSPPAPAAQTPQDPWNQTFSHGVLQGLAQDIAPSPAGPEQKGPLTMKELWSGNPLERIPGVRSAENWLYNYGKPDPDNDSWKQWFGQQTGNLIPSLAIPEERLATATESMLAPGASKFARVANRAATKYGKTWRGQTPKAAQMSANKVSRFINSLPKKAGTFVSGSAGGLTQPPDKDSSRGTNALMGGLYSTILGPVFRKIPRPGRLSHLIGHLGPAPIAAAALDYAHIAPWWPSLFTLAYLQSLAYGGAKLGSKLGRSFEGAMGAKAGGVARQGFNNIFGDPSEGMQEGTYSPDAPPTPEPPDTTVPQGLPENLPPDQPQRGQQ